MRLRRSLFVLLVAILGAAAAAQDAARYSGRALREVLDELREAGAPLVYSSNLVPPDLRVAAEPRASQPLALARELLAAHGLAIREAGGSWLVVRDDRGERPRADGSVSIAATANGQPAMQPGATAQLDPPNGPVLPLVEGRAEFGGVEPGRHLVLVRASGYLPERAPIEVQPGATAAVAIELAAAAPPLEELTVTASRYDLQREVQPSTAYFSQQQIENLAAFGGDALRAAQRLPGVATTEFSSRSHVRGGATDEMTVVLDGMKLFEPFHLRDYQSVFSALDQRIVSGIEVYSGGFPVAYGDALSGLTVIDRVEPAEPLRHELGVSLLYTSLLSSGTFDGGRAQWLASARWGNIDKLLQDEFGKPSYRDGFFHVGVTLTPKHKLALNDIGFDDDILLTPERSSSHSESARSNTDDNQFWLKVDSDWSDDLMSRSVVHATTFRSERRGAIADLDEIVGTVDDVRKLDAHGVKQDWEWNVSSRQLLTWGFEAEQLDGVYQYASAVELRGLLATLETELVRARAYDLAPEGESYGAYASDRVRLNDRVVAELGLRWDKQTYLPPGDDEQLSPRGSLLYRLAARTDLRFSYGRFFQSERFVDLQVEDGVLDFAPAQRASHSIAGFEHRFANDRTLRVEGFRKWTSNARPRYENLFDPFVLLPELRPGRVRIAPERAESRGLEVMLSGGGPHDWWAGYSYARTADIIGGQSVPRSWDQRHALSGGATFSAAAWTMNVVASVHSGWPATELELVPSTAPEAVDGYVVVAGPRNADRLRSVRRIDFRASRSFDAGPGALRFFAEITNATNRANPCCVSYDVVTLPNGRLQLDRNERRSLPLIANVGVLWQF